MKYHLDTDNSGHWYIIPTDKRKDWDKFVNLDENNTESWNTPKWAKPINGAPQEISFDKYEFI